MFIQWTDCLTHGNIQGWGLWPFVNHETMLYLSVGSRATLLLYGIWLSLRCRHPNWLSVKTIRCQLELTSDIIAVEGIQYHLLVRSLVSLSFQPLLIFSCICWPSRHRSVGASMNHNWASSRSHAVQWPTWHHRKVRVSRIFLPGANTFNSINSRDAGCKLGPNWANIADQITSIHNYIHHK